MRSRIDSCIGNSSIACGATQRTSVDSSLTDSWPPMSLAAKHRLNSWRTSPSDGGVTIRSARSSAAGVTIRSSRVTNRCAQAAGPRDEPLRSPLGGVTIRSACPRPGWLAGPRA
jgi:hypothetical protein